jgi:hypothetical protein
MAAQRVTAGLPAIDSFEAVARSGTTRTCRRVRHRIRARPLGGSGLDWVEVFYAWRPNLPDEADNHLIELGVAAQAEAIVTRNLRDVARGELKFPSLRVLTPEQCLEVFPCPP